MVKLWLYRIVRGMSHGIWVEKGEEVDGEMSNDSSGPASVHDAVSGVHQEGGRH